MNAGQLTSLLRSHHYPLGSEAALQAASSPSRAQHPQVRG